jgi:ADP-ribosylglycohydrolase
MLGAIAGDMIGSIYEARPIKSKDFPLFGPGCRFTDDTVLTVAVAEAILSGTTYGECLRRFGRRHPRAGYGASFHAWLQAEDPQPYNSWGNGAAMRVSPVGFAFDSERRVLEEAGRTAAVTHNHPEGIRGARATALAVFLARTGHSKSAIRDKVAAISGYDLNRRLDVIRPAYRFDISCQGTVPEALLAFLESASYEDAVRNAISLGGDSDTLACITGGIAEAFYGGVPESIGATARNLLPPDLLTVVDRFYLHHASRHWPAR